MKKIFYLVFSLILVILLSLTLTGVGCFGDQTAKANRLIDEHNDIFKEGKIAALGSPAMMPEVATSEEGSEMIFKWLEEVEDIVDEQKKELEDGLKLLGKAKKLNIDEKYKKYIKMAEKATKARIEFGEIIKADVVEQRKVHKAMRPTGPQNQLVRRAGKKHVELLLKAYAKEKEADELKDKAEKYFKDHNLGE